MSEILDHIKRIRIIPVVTIQQPEAAMLLADVLMDGGLPCVEITYRTDAAEKAIRAISGRKDFLVGAGTVLQIDQVKSAADAGARFVVTPGFNPKVVEYCLENEISIYPGASNPTDLTMAVEHGLEVVKFFPAEALGGTKTLKAIAAPFPMLSFIPTGGIKPENFLDYLALPQVVACGGSWLVNGDLIRQNKFDQISKLISEAVEMTENINEIGNKL